MPCVNQSTAMTFVQRPYRFANERSISPATITTSSPRLMIAIVETARTMPSRLSTSSIWPSVR